MSDLKKIFVQVNLNQEYMELRTSNELKRQAHKMMGNRLHDFFLVTLIPALRRRIGGQTFIGLYIIDPDFVIGMQNNIFHGISNYNNVIFDIQSKIKIPYDMINEILNNIIFSKQWLKKWVQSYEVYRNPATKDLKPETKKHFGEILDEL